MKKPPIGVLPRVFHDEKRLHDLAHTIHRRLQDTTSIPPEWIEEYNELVISLEKIVQDQTIK